MGHKWQTKTRGNYYGRKPKLFFQLHLVSWFEKITNFEGHRAKQYIITFPLAVDNTLTYMLQNNCLGYFTET
jgi:hypothetical protein